jgi:hypothetical protein
MVTRSVPFAQVAKEMLLNNEGFIPHLVDALLLDAEHPRKEIIGGIKTVVQRDFAECILQIALFPRGREALKAVPEVVQALDALVDKAWTDEAKDSARAALMQLTDRKPEVVLELDPDALHIMISCEFGSHLRRLLVDTARVLFCADQWDVQVTIKRIVAELHRRKYLVWFDLENMKGSIMVSLRVALVDLN